MTSSRGSGVTIEDGDDSGFDSDKDDSALAPSHKQNKKTAANHHKSTSNKSKSSSSSNNKSSGPDNTNRGGLSPGVESSFEVWLREYVNQPLLNILPEWISPNSISYTNTGACWTAFLFSYIAWKYEDLYPDLCCALRLMMAFLLFAGISLDCLDGMQARKTGRCSKFGEVLDHSLDAANVPLICSCILQTMMPDMWTIMISIIGGSMIYNAQLVIYRHHHIFVLPPVTGPAAQAIAVGAGIFFGTFYRFFSRHLYPVEVGIVIFCFGGNIAQFKNCAFYTNHLRHSFETSCLMPHVRFTLVMIFHATLLITGFITRGEYLLSSIILAYRLNGKYVLDTLQNFKAYTESHTKEMVSKEDQNWRWDCIVAIVILYIVGLTCGIGQIPKHVHEVTSVTGLPFITDSFFHFTLYLLMVAGVAINVIDLIKAKPILAKK